MDYKTIYNNYDLKAIEKKYNIYFDDKELLVKAFTHSSYILADYGNYERLEFLGDAVLELIVSDYMYRNHNDNEGKMSQLRSRLVNEYSLQLVMEQEGLDQYIILGKSIKGVASSKRTAYIADIYEAFIAAIYLDQGYEKANQFVLKTLLPRKEEIINLEMNIDYKTKFQELLQQAGTISIIYKTQPVNDEFKASVYVENKLMGIGYGASKKNAEQQAAKDALQKYVK